MRLTGAKAVDYEFAVTAGPSTARRRPPFNATWDVGGMVNVRPRTALGATLTAVVDDEDRTMFGIRPRLRHWLGGRASLDIAPAILVAVTSPSGSQLPTLPGISTFVGLGLGDLVAVTAQVEILRLGAYNSTDVTLLLGLRLGSWTALLAGPAAAGFVHWVRQID